MSKIWLALVESGVLAAMATAQAQQRLYRRCEAKLFAAVLPAGWSAMRNEEDLGNFGRLQVSRVQQVHVAECSASSTDCLRRMQCRCSPETILFFLENKRPSRESKPRGANR